LIAYQIGELFGFGWVIYVLIRNYHDRTILRLLWVEDLGCDLYLRSAGTGHNKQAQTQSQ
jgi:hypothetical protein